MTSQYIVVQYGNVMTGEYLNIGIYSYDLDQDKVYSKFITNFSRVRAAFDGAPDPFFEDVAMNWLRKIDTKAALQSIIEKSNSPYASLQFTTPRASLSSGEILAEELAKAFLTE